MTQEDIDFIYWDMEAHGDKNPVDRLLRRKREGLVAPRPLSLMRELLIELKDALNEADPPDKELK